MENVLTVPQVAKAAGVTESTVRTYIRVGKVKAMRLGREYVLGEVAVEAVKKEYAERLKRRTASGAANLAAHRASLPAGASPRTNAAQLQTLERLARIESLLTKLVGDLGGTTIQ